MIQTLVIFEASGDLTSRFLMPAIVRLHEENKLPEGFRVLGVAHDGWSQKQFGTRFEQKPSFAESDPTDVREEGN